MVSEHVKLLLSTLALVLLAEGSVAQFPFADTYLDVTTTQISFSWSDSDGRVPKNFMLEIDGAGCDVTNWSPKSCTKTGLTPGETYTVKYTADGGTTESDVTTVPLEPTIVSLSGSSTTELWLTFVAAAGGVQDHFEVQCGVSSTPLAEAKDVTGCDQPGECTIDIASCFDPDPMPGTEFTVYVTAVAADGATKSETASQSGHTWPRQPGPLTLGRREATTLVVSWVTADTVKTGHQVEVVPTAPGLDLSKPVPEVNGNYTLTLSPLTPGTPYTLTVRTQIGDESSKPTSGAFYTKPATPGSAPVRKEVNVSSLLVTWTAVTEGAFNNYVITVAKTTTPATVLQTGRVAKGALEYTFGSLEAGFEHTVTLQTAVNVGSGQEILSDTVSTSMHTTPNPPGNLREGEKEPTRLVVQWEAPADNSPFEHYRIQLGTERPLQVAKEQTSHQFTSLEAGADYVITLVAVTGGVDSDSASIIVTMQPMPPTNLVESTKTTSSLTFTWVAPVQLGPVSIYTYRVSRDGTGGTTVAESNTTSLEGSVNSGLTAGTTYTVEVWTITKGERSEPASRQVTLVPRPVSGLSNHSIGPNTITVVWTKPAGISDGFDVSWTSNSAGFGSQSVDGATTRYEISGLLPGTSYTVSVVSSSNGVKGQTESAIFATQHDTVTGLSRVDYGIDYITVSWNEPANVRSDTYELRISPNDASLSLPVSVDSSASRTYTFSSLTPGRLYTLSIVVVANGQRSEAHSQQYRTKPRPVKNLAAQTLDTSRIRLTFEAGTPLGEQDRFTIQYGQRTQNVGYDSSVTQYNETLQSLATGGTFIFIVSAVSGQENSDTTEISQTTKPAPVTITRSLAVNSTAVRLSWDPDSNSVQSGYRYRYRVESGSDGDWINHIPIQDTDVYVGGLQPGQKYRFEIEAVSGVQFSDGREATIVLYPLPPVNVTVDRVDTTSVTLSWTYDAARSVNTGWYIRYLVRGSSDKQDAGLLGFNDRSTTISGLVSGQHYTVEVYGRTHDGVESTEAVTRDVTIRPLPPGSLTLVRREATTLIVSWVTANTIKTGHQVELVPAVPGLDLSRPVPEVNGNYTLTLSPLTPGTPYTLTVRTQSGSASSEPTSGTFYTKPATPGAAPVRGEVTVSSLPVTWTAVTEGAFNNYVLTVAKTTTPATVLHTERVAKGTLEYTFGSLDAGFEHTVTLQTAVNVGSGQDILSDTVSTSMHTKPKPPGSLSLKDGTRHTTSFTVTWGPPEDGFYERYQVKVNSLAAVDVTKGNNPEKSFASLAAGTSHSVEVWTVSGDQNSAKVTGNFYTAPNPPRNLRESEKEPTRLVVQWEAPADNSPFEHYRIQLGTESPLQVAKQHTSHEFTSLGAGVDYVITLVAVTGRVDSDITSITLTMQPMPPTNLVESTKTTSSLTFTWVAPVQMGPVSAYTYRVSRDGTGGAPVAESNTTSLEGSANSGLTAGATYTVEVWTITKGERSQPASTQVTLNGVTEAPYSPFTPDITMTTEEDHCDEVMNVCDHVCIPNDVNYTCSCRAGYVLEADGVTCRDPCPRGTFVTGDTCVPCPHGHYQQYREKPQCHVCPHGYNTSDRGASSESHCRTVCDLAFGRCQNGGRCVTQDRLVSCDCGETGFKGGTCATDIDECLTRPCYNGGQCTNTRGGYECVCPTVGGSQYAGANCTDVVTVNRTPVTSSTIPLHGPLAGGTKITIHGEHFDTGFKPIRVNLARRYKCPIRESNDTYLVATTPGGDDSDVGVPLPIEVVFEGGLTISTGTSFEYRANPELTALYPNSTLLEGGSTITVAGNRLTSVSTPFLEITAELTEIIRETYNVITKTTKEFYQEKCSVLSDELAECRTPEIGLRERYNASDDQSTLSLYMGFVLDGFDEYRNLENTSLESSRQLGYIGGYTITPLAEVFVYDGGPLVLSVSSASRTKRSSPKEDMPATGEDSEYSLLIGQGECQILDRAENSLYCEVPSRVPAKLPHSTSEHHTITLSIEQTVNYTMGYLQYPNNLGIVIGLPVAAAAILVIAIITAVVVVEKRRRRNKDRREIKSPPDLDDWVVLPAPPSDRSLDGSMHSEKDVDKRERERVIRLQRDRRGWTPPSGQGLRDNWLLHSSNRNHTN